MTHDQHSRQPASSVRRTPQGRTSQGWLGRLLSIARRVFIVVAAFYTVMAVLGLIAALLNGHTIEFSLPLLGLLVFLVLYGVFAWFAEPLYWANEQRKGRRQLP